MKNEKIIINITIILLMGIMLISSYFILKNYKESKEQENTFTNLVEIVEEKSEDNESDEETINLEPLYKLNNDLIGWINVGLSN